MPLARSAPVHGSAGYATEKFTRCFLEQYIVRALRHKEMETTGWRLLHDLIAQAPLSEEELTCIHVALGFPVMAEKAVTETGHS